MNLQGKQIGNYIAKAELGSGGMGVVYLCEHPLIRRRVAAKVLHEELAASEEIVRRLFAEAKAANEIASEHIIEVIDFGRVQDEGHDLVYLLMEFLEGEGLGHRLWRVGLTIDESLHIVRQCTEALEASHKVGIVHRDLKPENIFLLERRGDPNFVKILDFGIAKVSGNPSTKTRTGVLLGTPAYMSPEQCRGSGAVDARADVYSLGIVLYELTTGDVPFAGDGYGQVLLAQMTEAPRPPTQINRDLPPVVEAIILRALAKDPAERYQSMAEMGLAIAEAEALLHSRVPVQQIPRKGLHQRDTFVVNGHKRGGGVASALAQIAPTPVDAAIAKNMATAAADAPTQLMGVVDPATLGLSPLSAVEGPATMVDRELPAHIAALTGQAPPAQDRSAPATTLSRDGAGNATTGPAGMMAPKLPQSAVATVVGGQVPTVIRAAERMPARKTDTMDDIDERAVFPRTGRYLLIGATVIALLGVLAALALR